MGVVLIGDYYLRAIALAILSFAAGSVIIGFSYGFVIGFASSGEATENVAAVGGVAVLVGSLVAIVGLVVAIGHYRRGAAMQNKPSPTRASAETPSQRPSGQRTPDASSKPPGKPRQAERETKASSSGSSEVAISTEPQLKSAGSVEGGFAVTTTLFPRPNRDWEDVFADEAKRRSLDAVANEGKLSLRIGSSADAGDALDAAAEAVAATNVVYRERETVEKLRADRGERDSLAIQGSVASWWEANRPSSAQVIMLYCEDCQRTVASSIVALSHAGHRISDRRGGQPVDVPPSNGAS